MTDLTKWAREADEAIAQCQNVEDAYEFAQDAAYDWPRDARRIKALIACAEALDRVLAVIDAAGLINLAGGVQLGQTSWYVKATDATDQARAAFADIAKLVEEE